MQIREYSAQDRAACIAIFKSNYPKFFAEDELAGLENWLNGCDAGKKVYESNKLEKFYVAVKENKVLGCGGFYFPKAESRGNMVWGMVNNSLHKHGIGSALLEYRIQKIKELKPEDPITLDTTQHSYRFFEKSGFKLTKITKDYYGAGLDRYDMVIR